MSDWSLPDFERKICPPEELAQRLHTLPRPLVFTNGCFDILPECCVEIQKILK